MSGSASQPTLDLASKLLGYLRRKLGEDGIRYAESPERIEGGNETFVYGFRLADAPEELSKPLVLRLFRKHQPGERARREAAVQNAVAAQGFPAPRVFAAEVDTDPLGGAFFVMERLPGEPMLSRLGRPDEAGLPRLEGPLALLRHGRELLDVPRALARVELRLHELDGDAFLRAVEAEGLPRESLTLDAGLAEIGRSLESPELVALRLGLDWILAQRPPDPERLVICHGDIQPLNILMVDGQLSGVVDWTHAIVADPALEIGWISMALRTVPLPAPRFLYGFMGRLQRRAAQMYVETYAADRPLSRDRVRYYEALRCLLVLVFLSERMLAGRSADPDAWNSPRAIRNIVARFRSITGLALEPPLQSASAG